MHCEIVQNILEEYLEGKLDETFRVEVEYHLQSCSYCQRELDLTKRIANFISVIPDPQVPEEIYENVIVEVRALQSQPTIRFNRIIDSLRGVIRYIGERITPRNWQVIASTATLLLVFTIFGGYYLSQKANVPQQPYAAETEIDPQQVAQAVEDIKFALSIVNIATKKTKVTLAKLPAEMGIDTAKRKAFETVREVDAKVSEEVLSTIRRGLGILTDSRSFFETNKS